VGDGAVGDGVGGDGAVGDGAVGDGVGGDGAVGDGPEVGAVVGAEVGSTGCQWQSPTLTLYRLRRCCWFCLCRPHYLRCYACDEGIGRLIQNWSACWSGDLQFLQLVHLHFRRYQSRHLLAAPSFWLLFAAAEHAYNIAECARLRNKFRVISAGQHVHPPAPRAANPLSRCNSKIRPHREALRLSW